MTGQSGFANMPPHQGKHVLCVSCRCLRRAALAVTLLALVAWWARPGPAARAASRAPSRSRVVLVGWSRGGLMENGREEISLVGTWSSASGWRNRREEDLLKLLPQGGTWTLYETGRPPVEVTADKPRWRRWREGDLQQRSVAAGLASRPPVTPGSWLAASGAACVDRRPVHLLPPTEDAVTKAVRQQLTKHHLWQSPDAHIQQNISVDLNGDGHDDRLVTVYQGMGTGPGGPVDLIVAAIAGRTGARHLTVMTEGSWKRVQRLGGFLGAQVVAVGDINGDGRCEVGIRLLSNDYAGLEVHTAVGTGTRRVLYADGGLPPDRP